MSWKALRASLVSNTRRMNHSRGSDSWQVERQPFKRRHQRSGGWHAKARPEAGGRDADLSAHVPTRHVREDGLQHDLNGGGLLAQGGEDGEEPIPHRYSIQTSVEVLVLGQVEPTGT